MRWLCFSSFFLELSRITEFRTFPGLIFLFIFLLILPRTTAKWTWALSSFLNFYSPHKIWRNETIFRSLNLIKPENREIQTINIKFFDKNSKNRRLSLFSSVYFFWITFFREFWATWGKIARALIGPFPAYLNMTHNYLEPTLDAMEVKSVSTRTLPGFTIKY